MHLRLTVNEISHRPIAAKTRNNDHMGMQIFPLLRYQSRINIKKRMTAKAKHKAASVKSRFDIIAQRLRVSFTNVLNAQPRTKQCSGS